ncbi:hypothetical protein OU798_16040 [Prolixibacteraceae bacterium Z1-6]|uniref:Uncharacterized protein n=2 Tax=Draconibacterium aestuarii TaxID=2998507 RepID=A0A9X3F7A2_9BACT|nr:hypothetical protein [Prolixibacteraceae bacterium Z1-6]
MSNSKKVVKTIRMTAEFNDKFETAFEESNFDSKGEYLESLFDKANDDEPTVEIEEVEKVIEVEKKLKSNQLLITLTPAQQFVLREHVTRSPDFAQEQNRVIEKLANKPWWASNDVYKPEFQELWIRNIELDENMEESERQDAIKHNMSAFIINMFLVRLISNDLDESEVRVEDIETFILEQSEISKSVEDENAA